MGVMKILTTAAGAAVAVSLAVPAVAANQAIKELGEFDTTVKGGCPAKPCFAFSRTTAYQAKIGDTKSPMVAPADGRIVAFTVGLGKPGKKQTAFFESRLGGKPSMQITILNPPKKLRSRAIVNSEAINPAPYFGTTATFALQKSVPVKKGQIVALTSTTWTPVMQVNQPATTSWRASRNKGTCDDVSTQTAQTTANQLARYYCLYKNVRLVYSVTFIANATPAS
jgi:hypothetical protein